MLHKITKFAINWRKLAYKWHFTCNAAHSTPRANTPHQHITASHITIIDLMKIAQLLHGQMYENRLFVWGACVFGSGLIYRGYERSPQPLLNVRRFFDVAVSQLLLFSSIYFTCYFSCCCCLDVAHVGGGDGGGLRECMAISRCNFLQICYGCH